MKYNNFEALVKHFNDSLKDFSNVFVVERKKLTNQKRTATKGRLFSYDPTQGRLWAINEGGGTEIQYQIYIDWDAKTFYYGLGINTQYVPFANKMSTIDYAKPFAQVFLSEENRIREMLPNYEFVIGNADRLRNLEHDRYVLFGVEVTIIINEDDSFEIAEGDIDIAIENLQKQFEAYKLVFEEKNKLDQQIHKLSYDMKKYISLLEAKHQIILQGAPGTGKTYTAKKIAEALTKHQLQVAKPNTISNSDIINNLKEGEEIDSAKGKTSYKLTKITDSDINITGDTIKTGGYLINFNEIKEAYKNKIWDSGQANGNDPFTAAIAKKIYDRIEIETKDNAYYKLVQFHPSYTYEDFVRGIVVSTENSDKPQYLTVNKVLGEFAENALKNWKDSQKDEEVLTEENVFESQLEEFKNKVIEENATNAGTYYSIKGTTAIITDVTDSSFRFTYDHDRRVNYTLLFSDLRKLNVQKAQLSQVKDVDSYELEMKQKASYYYRVYNEIKSTTPTNDATKPKVDLQNYVLIIDEINRANLPAVLGELIYALEYRGEAVDTMYKLEDGDNKLTLPPNLYIIGTMNTADRSIGQIDYAIRRRFAFVDVEAKDLSGELKENFDLVLFNKVKELFTEEHMSSEFEAKDVQLGHSYFIIDKNHTRDIRLKYEIKPILREYMRDGILLNNKVTSDKIEGL